MNVLKRITTKHHLQRLAILAHLESDTTGKGTNFVRLERDGQPRVKPARHGAPSMLHGERADYLFNVNLSQKIRGTKYI